MKGAVESGELEQLVRSVQPGARLVRAWDLPGGLSARMTAVEVVLPDGRVQKFAIRRPGQATLAHNPAAAAHEYRVLQAVRAAGVAAPAPLHLEPGGGVLAQPALMLEFVEGRAEYAPGDCRSFAVQMATQLARIHSVDGSSAGLTFLPRQEDRVARLLSAQGATLDESLQEGSIRVALAPAWPLPQPQIPRLLHGDFWPGNLLWRDGQLIAVIDWEDAELGNPLGDLAISRLDLLWTCGIEAMHEFTRFYQTEAACDLSDLPYWDLAAALRPAGRLAEWAAGWPGLGRPDVTEESMRAAHKWFVEAALDALAVGRQP